MGVAYTVGDAPPEPVSTIYGGGPFGALFLFADTRVEEVAVQFATPNVGDPNWGPDILNGFNILSQHADTADAHVALGTSAHGGIVASSSVGVPNGIAQLDDTGTVVADQVPVPVWG